MKALTLWQPWASLIALGEKRYETRSWATSYRGLLAIHASAPKPQVWPYLTRHRELALALERHRIRSRLASRRAPSCASSSCSTFTRPN